jgi:aminopeptidase N
MLNELRMELGDEKFYRAMHAWFREKKFGVATTRDFIRVMQQSSGRDLHDFFENHRVYVNDQE